MEEDGFTLVKRTKKGKNKVNNPSKSPGPYSKEAHPDLSTEEIQEYIRYAPLTFSFPLIIYYLILIFGQLIYLQMHCSKNL